MKKKEGKPEPETAKDENPFFAAWLKLRIGAVFTITPGLHGKDEVIGG